MPAHQDYSKHGQPANRPNLPNLSYNPVNELASLGFNACWTADKEHLNSFIKRIRNPFETNPSQEDQLHTFAALCHILNTFVNDLADASYRTGLAEALGCVQSVLLCNFDFTAGSSCADLKDFSLTLLTIIQLEHFLPAAVLASNDPTSLQTATRALSSFLWCCEYISETEFSSTRTKTALIPLIREGLQAAVNHIQDRVPGAELTEIDTLKVALIRDWANMALYFPSRELSEPLLSLARASATLAEEPHLFFPDVEPPDEEAEWDAWDDDSNERCQDADSDLSRIDFTRTDNGGWEASMEINDGGFEIVVEACFSALAFCQDGKHILPIWKKILRSLEPEDTEWTSALVGLSMIEPEKIDIYLLTLFDQITESEEDEYITGDKQETAMNAILELLAANASSGATVTQVFGRYPTKAKQLIADRFAAFFSPGETLLLTNYRCHPKSLKERVVQMFGLSTS
jgi:hypothetical protein